MKILCVIIRNIIRFFFLCFVVLYCITMKRLGFILLSFLLSKLLLLKLRNQLVWWFLLHWFFYLLLLQIWGRTLTRDSFADIIILLIWRVIFFHLLLYCRLWRLWRLWRLIFILQWKPLVQRIAVVFCIQLLVITYWNLNPTHQYLLLFRILEILHQSMAQSLLYSNTFLWVKG